MLVLPLTLGLAACASGPEAPAQPSPGTGVGSAPSSPPGSLSTAALRGEWQLVSLRQSGEDVVPPAGHRFSAEFRSDDSVHLVADCNRCFASYKAGEGSIEVGVMACTRAYCETAPIDTDFAGLVQGSRRWSVVGQELRLESDQGSLSLRR